MGPYDVQRRHALHQKMVLRRSGKQWPRRTRVQRPSAKTDRCDDHGSEKRVEDDGCPREPQHRALPPEVKPASVMLQVAQLTIDYVLVAALRGRSVNSLVNQSELCRRQIYGGWRPRECCRVGQQSSEQNEEPERHIYIIVGSRRSVYRWLSRSLTLEQARFLQVRSPQILTKYRNRTLTIFPSLPASLPPTGGSCCRLALGFCVGGSCC